MWANFLLLFWISLIPFATAWVDDGAEGVPVAVFGVVLLMCAMSWLVLQQVIFRIQGPNSALRAAIGRDWKGPVSAALYFLGIGMAFVWPLFSLGCYVAVAVLWLMPDRRIESALLASGSGRDQG